MNNESNTAENPNRNGSCLEKKAQTKTFCLGVGCGVALVLLAQSLLLYLAHWIVDGDPVSNWQMSKLESKPKMEVVVDLLGKPEKVYERETEIEYIYGSPWQWKYLTIIFDKEGNMKRYFIDD